MNKIKVAFVVVALGLALGSGAQGESYEEYLAFVNFHCLAEGQFAEDVAKGRDTGINKELALVMSKASAPNDAALADGIRIVERVYASPRSSAEELRRKTLRLCTRRMIQERAHGDTAEIPTQPK